MLETINSWVVVLVTVLEIEGDEHQVSGPMSAGVTK